MILITGGAYQGKQRFVTDVLGIAPERALFNAHEYIAKALENGEDAEILIDGILSRGNIEAVTCNEIGMGIVPADSGERRRREVTGRIMCRFAERADTVYRLVCGIPIKIK